MKGLAAATPIVTDDIVIISLVRGKSYMSSFVALDLWPGTPSVSSHIFAHPTFHSDRMAQA